MDPQQHDDTRRFENRSHSEPIKTYRSTGRSFRHHRLDLRFRLPYEPIESFEQLFLRNDRHGDNWTSWKVEFMVTVEAPANAKVRTIEL
jgi:hypothetical protein